MFWGCFHLLWSRRAVNNEDQMKMEGKPDAQACFEGPKIRPAYLIVIFEIKFPIKNIAVSLSINRERER